MHDNSSFFELKNNSSSLWSSRNSSVLENAAKLKIPVNLFYNLKYFNERYDFCITGRLKDVFRNDILFSVDEYKYMEGKQYPEIPGCSFSFIMVEFLSKGRKRLGYSGKAIFTNPFCVQTKNIPSTINMHFSPRMNIRQMRTEPRVFWSSANIKNIGIFIVNGMPVSWDSMHSLIHNYIKLRTNSPLLKNISAGGCCIGINSNEIIRIQSGTQKYLFFITLTPDINNPSIAMTYPFLCRKVGMNKNPNEYILRLKFTHEPMFSFKEKKPLKWRDIEYIASSKLRNDIRYYNGGEFNFQTSYTSDTVS